MGVPKRTFIDQLTIDTGCKEQELKTAMTNWNKADMSTNAELAQSGNVRNVPQCLRIQYFRLHPTNIHITIYVLIQSKLHVVRL